MSWNTHSTVKNRQKNTKETILGILNLPVFNKADYKPYGDIEI